MLIGTFGLNDFSQFQLVLHLRERNITNAGATVKAHSLRSLRVLSGQDEFAHPSAGDAEPEDDHESEISNVPQEIWRELTKGQ